MAEQYDSVTRSGSYNALLERVFIANAPCTKALFDASLVDRSIRKLVAKALASGHMKVYTYQEFYGVRRRSHKYVSLTAAGIRYLAAQSTLSCSPYIPTDIKRVAVFESGSNAQTIAYSVRCSNSILFAKAANAQLSAHVYTRTASPLPQKKNNLRSTEDIETTPEFGEAAEHHGGHEARCETCEAEGDNVQFSLLADIRKETAARMDAAGQVWQQPSPQGIIFFPTQDVKALLREYDKTTKQRTDFYFVRYTGILVSPKCSFLVYHARHAGLPWVDKFEDNDIRVLRKFDLFCSPYTNVQPDGIEGIVLVYNAKNFGDIVRNKFQMREDQYAIGTKFSTLRLVPLSQMGADLVQWIVTNPKTNRIAFVNQAAHRLCEATPNGGTRSRAFRLANPEGLIFDGTEMDLKTILLAIKAVEQDQVITFKVLCFPWQQEYYRAIWPDVECVPLTG